MTILTRFLNSLLLTFLLCSTAFAGQTASTSPQIDLCVTIQEVDGSPKNANCKTLLVPNGSLTNTGTAYSLSTSGGGGGGSGTVNTGVAGHIPYYPGNGTTLDDAPNLTTNGVDFTSILTAAGTLNFGEGAGYIKIYSDDIPIAWTDTIMEVDIDGNGHGWGEPSLNFFSQDSYYTLFNDRAVLDNGAHDTKLGINTFNPTAPLDVIGEAHFSDVTATGTNTTLMTIDELPYNNTVVQINDDDYGDNLPLSSFVVQDNYGEKLLLRGYEIQSTFDGDPEVLYINAYGGDVQIGRFNGNLTNDISLRSNVIAYKKISSTVSQSGYFMAGHSQVSGGSFSDYTVKSYGIDPSGEDFGTSTTIYPDRYIGIDPLIDLFNTPPSLHVVSSDAMQGLASVALNNPGDQYVPGDLLVIDGGNNDLIVNVSTSTNNFGPIETFNVVKNGTRYSTTTGATSSPYTYTPGRGATFDLTVDGTSGSVADTNGGNLYLESGGSTGTGYSKIQFKTATKGSSGRAFNAPSTKMTINGTGYVGIGNTSPDALLTLGTAGGTVGVTKFYNATSGSITVQPVTGALGTRTLSLPAETGTLCSTGSVCSGYQASGSYITALTGDVVASGPGSVASTIQANAVALATDTTGDFVGRIIAGTGISTTGASTGENITHTLSLASAYQGWTDDGTELRETTSTDDVEIGSAGTLAAKLAINGDSDEIQFLAQGHSTQTNPIVTVEKSDGTDILTIGKTDVTVTANGTLLIGSSVPFSDSAGTLTFKNVDAIDSTTETTFESALDRVECKSYRPSQFSITGTIAITGDATQGFQIDGSNGGVGLIDATTDEGGAIVDHLPPNFSSFATSYIWYSMQSATSGTVELELFTMCQDSGDSQRDDADSFSGPSTATETVPSTVFFPKRLSLTPTDDSCGPNKKVTYNVSTDSDDGTNDTASGDRRFLQLDVCINTSGL